MNAGAPVRPSLADLNGMDRAAFVQAVGGAFEHSPWVAERAYTTRPFADLEALHRAMSAVLETAEASERLTLIRAHPELAGKAAIAGALTPESRLEQGRAGLDQLTKAELAQFRRLNAAYGARFGFPFIICARVNDKTSILAAMERRLANTFDEETAEAMAQIALIGRYRLADAVAP
jgi:2-oxo-4-hydroxy-4-carboxy-5-ureidoimidazoline decarboxylase